MVTNKRKRGAHRRADCVYIGVWVPKVVAAAIDADVIRLDSDRSKVIRRVLENHTEKG
jgi:hypothetical protein